MPLDTLPETATVRLAYRFTVAQIRTLVAGGVVADADELSHIDRQQYRRMAELGVLTEDEPVELIRGEVTPKMPQGDLHAVTVERLDRRLQRLLPDEYAVRCQCPVNLAADTEPEPDVAVCLPADRRGGVHPTVAHLFLVVEVADSSLADDRTRKHELYAEAAVPEYWIVNLEDRLVEVYTSPVAADDDTVARYATRTDYRPGQQLPVTLGGVTVGQLDVSAILA